MSRREDRMSNPGNPSSQPQKEQNDPSKKQKQDQGSPDRSRDRSE